MTYYKALRLNTDDTENAIRKWLYNENSNANDNNSIVSIPKNTASPYLHELVKATVLYDSGSVLFHVKQLYPKSRLLSDWEIAETRQEVVLSNWNYTKHKTGDVVWVLKKVNDYGDVLENSIVHEIKTGAAVVYDIYKNYEGVRYRGGCTVMASTANPLWIWAWKDKFVLPVSDTEASKTIQTVIKRGGLRLISIELIADIMTKRLSDMGLGVV